MESLAHHLDVLPTSTREWLLSTAGLADLCVAVGDSDRARHLYHRLLPYAHLHVIGNVLGPPHGPTSLRLGRLARLLGNHANARRHLDDAARQAESMHSRPYAVQARAELDLVIRANGALSPREREIAELVAEGLSNRDIGRRLFISARTSETHISHILRKLELPSRSAIAAWVTRAHI